MEQNSTNTFLKDKLCPKPFEYMDIIFQIEGRIDCYPCAPPLVPHIVGDLNKESIDSVWNGESYNKIRNSILDGSYQYCKKDLCPDIINKHIPHQNSYKVSKYKKGPFTKDNLFPFKPKVFNLNFDRTCNLSCPSCRNELITTLDEDEDKVIKRLVDQIIQRDLSDTTLVVCSSGDPFFSKHYRKLLFEIDGQKHTGLNIQIMTNGLLFTRDAWTSMHKIHQNIHKVCISIDAATEATYQITRRGGNFQSLLDNLAFLSMLRSRDEITFLRLDFVVQDHNFQEMIDFIELGKKFKVDQVYFQRIINWGTFSKEEFEKRNIFDNQHPKHQLFLEIVNHSAFEQKIVNLGNLTSFNQKIYQKKNPLSLFLKITNNYFNPKNAFIHSFRNLKRKLRNL